MKSVNNMLMDEFDKRLYEMTTHVRFFLSHDNYWTKKIAK